MVKPQAGESASHAGSSLDKAPLDVRGSVHPQYKEGSMLAGKPYLTLHIETVDVPYKVSVNGGFVATDREGNPASMTVPINQWLRSGGNELTLVLFPHKDESGKRIFEDSARAVLKLQLQQAGALEEKPITIATLTFRATGTGTQHVLDGSSPAARLDSARNFEPAAGGDVAIGAVRSFQQGEYGEILVSQSVDLQLPLLEWAFFRSDAVKQVHELSEAELDAAYEKLLKAYDAIYQGLKSKNLDAIMPLFEERSRETDQALYQPRGSTDAKLRALFEEAMNDPKLQLNDIHPKEGFWAFDVGPTGRILRLSFGDRGGPIIHYSDPKAPGYFTVFPIYFRVKDGKYIVTR